jgi:excisionase family DNA binding protein
VKLPEVLTVAEIAAYWRVSGMTVYRWVNDGDLESFKMGRTIRVTREAHDAFAAKKKRGGEK